MGVMEDVCSHLLQLTLCELDEVIVFNDQAMDSVSSGAFT
jgi:hypothetical protein